VRKSYTLLSMILAVLALAGAAQAIQVFVWKHDNNLAVRDAVYGATYTATQSVIRALQDLRIPYDSSSVLPEDMSRYDVVITCLSFYCPG